MIGWRRQMLAPQLEGLGRMSDPNLPKAGVQAHAGAIDIPHAPFLYFENAPTFGHLNGVFHVMLSANRYLPGADNKIQADSVVVAHLRGNRQALESLRSAIDGALLLGAKTDGNVQ